MQQIDEGVEPALAGTAAADYHGVQITAVLSAVQTHADVLGEYLVGFRVFCLILPVDGGSAAPLGRAVFLPTAVVAAGGQDHANGQGVNEQKNKDSVFAVLTELDLEGMFHRCWELRHNFHKPAGHKGSHQQGQPHHRDDPQNTEDLYGAPFIVLHGLYP